MPNGEYTVIIKERMAENPSSLVFDYFPLLGFSYLIWEAICRWQDHLHTISTITKPDYCRIYGYAVQWRNSR